MTPENELRWYANIADVEVYEEPLGAFPGWRAVPRDKDGRRLGSSSADTKRGALAQKRRYLAMAEKARKRLAVGYEREEK